MIVFRKNIAVSRKDLRQSIKSFTKSPLRMGINKKTQRQDINKALRIEKDFLGNQYGKEISRFDYLRAVKKAKSGKEADLLKRFGGLR